MSIPLIGGFLKKRIVDVDFHRITVFLDWSILKLLKLLSQEHKLYGLTRNYLKLLSKCRSHNYFHLISNYNENISLFLLPPSKNDIYF